LSSAFSQAERLLRSLGVTEPEEIDLEALAWHMGVVKVKYRELDGCEARIVGLGDQAIITVDNRAIPRRRRFSLAHELGHWHLHRGKTLLCRHEDIGERRDGNDAERWPAAGLVDTWIRFSPDRRPLHGTKDIQPRVQARGG